MISFDTTGSMHGVLRQVRQELARLTDTLFTNSAARGISVRLAVIAQGDYGGRIAIDDHAATYGSNYTVLGTPFSPIPAAPMNFIRSVDMSAHQASEGGEAYEQVLRMARNMAWRPTAQKVLVVVGDDTPHTPECHGNTDHVDWRAEASALVATGVRIFAVQCMTGWDHAEPFWRSLGVSGAYLQMTQFSTIVPLLLATFYTATSERSLVEGLEAELQARGRYSRGLEVAFNTLLQRADAGRAAYPGHAATGAGAGPARVPVAPGRFQRLAVAAEMSIRDFVEDAGARYKAGGGYYELSKPEDISAKKSVVLEHIASGEMFTGEDARAMLGLSATNTKARPSSVPAGYRAFVQSTSQNRKLVAGTSFLWEVDPNA